MVWKKLKEFIFPGGPEKDEEETSPPQRENIGERKVISVNLDGLSCKERGDFEKIVAQKTGIPIFQGKAIHAYSKDHVGSGDTCPRCKAPTQRMMSNFVYATDVAPRVMLAPAGLFCPGCPTVVIDELIIKEGIIGGFQYSGVVALTRGKDTEPDFFETWNGERPVYIFDENQVLQGLTTIPESKKLGPSRSQIPYLERGRNDPCSCGSGKKFKKCCRGKMGYRE